MASYTSSDRETLSLYLPAECRSVRLKSLIERKWPCRKVLYATKYESVTLENFIEKIDL
jgi:hypothetical protein